MKRTLPIFAVLATLLLAPLAAAAPPPVSGSQAVDDAWKKAVLAGDLDAVTACYSPTAVLWFPGSPESRGEAAIRAAYKGLFDANSVTDVALTETHYETFGDTSIAWGRYSMTLTPKAGGAPVSMTGRFSSVSKMEKGKWVYVMDHASDDPPPAPPAK
jgi:uncharacterized protein (TIGR02246 family)